VELPELSNILDGAPIRIWWENNGEIRELGPVSPTNSSGWYTFDYQVPLDENFGTVTLWANYSAHDRAYFSNESNPIQIQITNYDTSLNIFSNETNYYLNETIHIYGLLQRDDAVPVASQLIDLYIIWHNGSIKHLQLLTNSSGYYYYSYPLTTDDGIGIAIFDANFSSSTRLYNNCTISAPHNVILELYTLTFTSGLNDSSYYLDEVIQFSGTVAFDENGRPLRSETLTIYYKDGNGLQSFVDSTDNSGYFEFQYVLSVSDALGAIYVWANFTSSNPLWDNSESENHTAQLILYEFDLYVETNATQYYLNQTVHIQGRLNFSDGGQGLAGQYIGVWWNNGSENLLWPAPQTNDSGYFEFYYSLSTDTDDNRTITIHANFTTIDKKYDNATSTPLDIELELYKFALSIQTNQTSYYYLNQTVEVSGILTWEETGSPVSGVSVDIWWDWNNGSVMFLGSDVTNSSGGYDIGYGLSTSKDSVGTITIWAEYNDPNPLHDNATSPQLDRDLRLYDFVLTIQTNRSYYYLNQTVFISGILTWEEGGAPVFGESVDFWWDWNNGSVMFLGSDVTNSSGGYDFNYALSTSKDEDTTVTIWANYSNPNPLYNNGSSPTTDIDILLYDFVLTIQTDRQYYYLNQTVYISGILTWEEGGSPFSGQSINIYWDWNNGTVMPLGPGVTNSSGGYDISYVLSTSKDENTTVTIWVEFTNTNPLWDNESSSTKDIDLRLYAFTLTIFTNDTNYYLNQTVHVWGRLTYDENNAPLVGGMIRVYWINDSQRQFQWYATNSSGYFNFYYNLTPIKDDNRTITIRAAFINTNPLWNDALSQNTFVTLKNYSFLLTISRNASSYFLDQVVHVWGQLTYEENGAPVPGQNIRIHWDDGVYQQFEWYPTNASGYFNFYYNLTIADGIGSVSIWADFVTMTPGWQGTLSTTTTIQKVLYQLQLDVNTNTSVYLDQNVTIWGNLTHSGTVPAVGIQVKIYMRTNTVWIHIGTETTDGFGYFEHEYSFIVPPDTPGTYYFKCNTSAGSLYNDTETIEYPVFVFKQSIGLGIVLTPNPVYLNETITISVWVIYAYNMSGVTNVNVSIFWDWGNGSVVFIANATTDGNGLAIYNHTGMSDYKIWTGINIFANFSETPHIYGAESLHESLTLQQWDSIITGFNTGGTQFRPLEIVTISGSLFYTNLSGPDVPFIASDVILIANGTLITTTQTQSDGSFTYDWILPSTIALGLYEIEARFISGVNWIDNYTSLIVSITIRNYVLVWEFQVTPNSVYRSEYLYIEMNLTLDNGSAYVGATIDIYWEHVDAGSSPTILDSVTTNINGSYTNYYRIEVTAPLGTTNLWLSCIPEHIYINPGISSIETIQIQLIPVNLEASVDTTFAYLGESIIFSGSLTFGNLTPMEDYSVEIIWSSGTLEDSWNESSVINSSGLFKYVYYLPWDYPVGISSFYIRFEKPNEAFVDNQTGLQSVEIWDQVNIILGLQTITEAGRRDTVPVTGFVSNPGLFNVSDVLVLLIESNVTREQDTTDENGRFSMSYNVPNNAQPGFLILSVNISAPYYELIQSGFWNLTIKLVTYLVLEKIDPLNPLTDQWSDLMPGESLNFTVRLQDEAGSFYNDTDVAIYLNDTLLRTSYLNSTSPNMIQITIPANWATSGYYYLNLSYSGSTFTFPTWEQISDDIHIFTQVFVNITGDTVVPPLTPILIQGILLDDQNNPIINREVSLVYNEIPRRNETTDENGVFSYSLDSTNITGTYNYTIIFYSKTGNLPIGPFTLTVRAQAGPTMDAMVIVFWIAVIAVEMVIALLVITRKRFSYTRLSRQFYLQIRTRAKNNQQLMLKVVMKCNL
jgi:hypothetical protein